MSTPIFNLSDWAAAMAQPWNGQNSNVRILEALIRGSVADRDLASPPVSCANGATYLVKSPATGAWTGHAGEVAVAVGVDAANGWLFMPVEFDGFLLWIADEGVMLQYDQGTDAWVEFSGGGGGAAWTGPFRTHELAVSAGIADPTSGLNFPKTERRRYFELIGSRFYAHRDDLGFDAKLYTDTTEAGTIAYSWSAGKMRMAFSGGTTLHAFKRAIAWTPDAPQFAMEIRLDTKGAAASYNGFGFMARKDANNWIQVVLDGTNAWVEKKIAGSLTSPIGSNVAFALPAVPFWISVVVSNDRWTLYYRTADDRPWVYILSRQVTGIDLMDPAVMVDYKLGFHAYSSGNTTWEFSKFNAGYFGGVGLRDMKPVTYRDGSPYTVGGYHYFAATFASPGVPAVGVGPGIPYSHSGIFRYNFLTRHLEKTASIFVSRSSKVYSDGTLKVVYDDVEGAWRVLMGTWANGVGGELRINHQLFRGDILNGVHVLHNLSELAIDLPVGGSPVKGAYDQDLVYDSVDELWRLSYTYTPDTTFPSAPMYIAQDTSPDLVTFTNVLNDSANDGFEGTNFFQYDDVLYLAGASLTTNRVFNARTGAHIGALDYSRPTPAVIDIIPHPCLVPVLVENRTRTFLMTFDGTPDGSAGDSSWSTMCILEATEVETGFELPARGVM